MPGLKSKLQILCYDGSIYVNKSSGAGGFNVDRKGGTTIGVRKNGGWWLSWLSALRCAGVAWINIQVYLNSEFVWDPEA